MSAPPISEGVALFNEQRFWHAHEAWERLWLIERGPEKRFLQGLIQLAAAYHHVVRGNHRGARRLFDAALAKLEPFDADHDGVDRAQAIVRAAHHRDAMSRGESVDPEEFPRLKLVR